MKKFPRISYEESMLKYGSDKTGFKKPITNIRFDRHIFT